MASFSVLGSIKLYSQSPSSTHPLPYQASSGAARPSLPLDPKHAQRHHRVTMMTWDSSNKDVLVTQGRGCGGGGRQGGAGLVIGLADFSVLHVRNAAVMVEHAINGLLLRNGLSPTSILGGGAGTGAGVLGVEGGCLQPNWLSLYGSLDTTASTNLFSSMESSAAARAHACNFMSPRSPPRSVLSGVSPVLEPVSAFDSAPSAAEALPGWPRGGNDGEDGGKKHGVETKRASDARPRVLTVTHAPKSVGVLTETSLRDGAMTETLWDPEGAGCGGASVVNAGDRQLSLNNHWEGSRGPRATSELDNGEAGAARSQGPESGNVAAQHEAERGREPTKAVVPEENVVFESAGETVVGEGTTQAHAARDAFLNVRKDVLLDMRNELRLVLVCVIILLLLKHLFPATADLVVRGTWYWGACMQYRLTQIFTTTFVKAFAGTVSMTVQIVWSYLLLIQRLLFRVATSSAAHNTSPPISSSFLSFWIGGSWEAGDLLLKACDKRLLKALPLQMEQEERGRREKGRLGLGFEGDAAGIKHMAAHAGIDSSSVSHVGVDSISASDELAAAFKAKFESILATASLYTHTDEESGRTEKTAEPSVAYPQTMLDLYPPCPTQDSLGHDRNLGYDGSGPQNESRNERGGSDTLDDEAFTMKPGADVGGRSQAEGVGDEELGSFSEWVWLFQCGSLSDWARKGAHMLGTSLGASIGLWSPTPNAGRQKAELFEERVGPIPAMQPEGQENEKMRVGAGGGGTGEARKSESLGLNVSDNGDRVRVHVSAGEAEAHGTCPSSVLQVEGMTFESPSEKLKTDTFDAFWSVPHTYLHTLFSLCTPAYDQQF
jgi:hypothetical protein